MGTKASYLHWPYALTRCGINAEYLNMFSH